MDCIFISPEEKKEFKNIASATIPAPSGEMGILPGHAEAFVRLKKGEVTFKKEGDESENSVQIKGGICRVENNKIIIIQDGKNSFS